MLIVSPRVIVYKLHEFDTIKKLIEINARRCYRSEDKIKEGSADKIIEKLRDLGHDAMLEFGTICVEFTCDRGISHEIVRHRLPSYAQQSTRYCDEGSEKKFSGVNFIKPFFFEPSAGKKKTIIPKVFFSTSGESCIALSKSAEDEYEMNAWDVWTIHCLWSEWAYQTLRDQFGAKPQEARAILPNCLRTVIGTQTNIREWRHILKLRCAKAAHPQIRQIMIPLLKFFQKELPVLFNDIEYDDEYKFITRLDFQPEDIGITNIVHNRFHCPICNEDAGTTIYGMIQEHITKVGERFQCEECGAKFTLISKDDKADPHCNWEWSVCKKIPLPEVEIVEV